MFQTEPAVFHTASFPAGVCLNTTLCVAVSLLDESICCHLSLRLSSVEGANARSPFYKQQRWAKYSSRTEFSRKQNSLLLFLALLHFHCLVSCLTSDSLSYFSRELNQWRPCWSSFRKQQKSTERRKGQVRWCLLSILVWAQTGLLMAVCGIGTSTAALEHVLPLQGCSGAGLEGLWGQEGQLQPSLQCGVSWVCMSHTGREEAMALWRCRAGTWPDREMGREQTSGKEPNTAPKSTKMK